MPPPEGVVANLQHPTDVLRTINFVTQGLTLASCSFFVFIRAFYKIRAVGLDLAVDDYLTFISWILMIGYCVCGIFRKYAV
ncbi:integral membrane protein [Paraphaeosphaeria sporulosa]